MQTKITPQLIIAALLGEISLTLVQHGATSQAYKNINRVNTAKIEKIQFEVGASVWLADIENAINAPDKVAK